MASGLKTAGAGTLLAFAILQSTFDFHDSPVDAASSSIYAKVRWFHYLHKHNNSDSTYKTKPDNPDIITTSGFQSQLPPLTGTGGWKISLTAAGTGGTPGSALICSNEACDYSNIDKDRWIYFKVPDASGKWKPNSGSRTLYYYDLTNGCANSPHGTCEVLTSITITTKLCGSYTSAPSDPNKWTLSIGGKKGQATVQQNPPSCRGNSAPVKTSFDEH
jgi:hypothetical protein